MAFVLSSCGTTPRDVANKSQRMLKGVWTLDQIKMDQSNFAEITSLFGQKKSCMQGGTLRLIPNNNTGYYITNSSCGATKQNIEWFIEEKGSTEWFYFKEVAEGEKAKDVTTGYKLKVISKSEDSFHLTQEVPFENQAATIHLFFTRQPTQ